MRCGQIKFDLPAGSNNPAQLCCDEYIQGLHNDNQSYCFLTLGVAKYFAEGDATS
jgi:hypothetical protein